MNVLAMGAVALLLDNNYNGRASSPGWVGERLLARLAPLLGAQLLVLAVTTLPSLLAAEFLPTVAAMMVLILMLPISIIFSLRLVFWMQVITVEDETATSVWRRTWEVTRGNAGYILGRMLVLGLVLALVFGALAAVAVVGVLDVGEMNWAAILLSIAVYILLAPIGLIAQAVLFFDVRANR